MSKRNDDAKAKVVTAEQQAKTTETTEIAPEAGGWTPLQQNIYRPTRAMEGEAA